MTLFSEAPSWARAALREADPYAIVGTSGDNVGGMAEGRDWWVRGTRARHGWTLRQQHGTHACQARHHHDSLDRLRRSRPYYSLSHCEFARLGDPAFALFAEATLVNPDLSLPEVGRDLAAALLPMRRGLAKLFSGSAPSRDGVFVIMSSDSSPVLAIHGFESLGFFAGGGAPAQSDLGTAARESSHTLLNTMGIGWRAIDPADVEAGESRARRRKSSDSAYVRCAFRCRMRIDSPLGQQRRPRDRRSTACNFH